MWSMPRLGALAGGAGGLAMVLAGLALQPLAGLPTLPDLLQDRAVKLTPGPLFGLLIDRLQYAGRPLLYSGLLLVELVVLTLVERIRQKAAVSAHLPKGASGHHPESAREAA